MATENEPAGECSLVDVGCWTDWLVSAIGDFFLWIWEGILSGVATVLESIDLPDWMQNVGSLTLPDDVVFWMSIFQINQGLAIIASAYTIRFLIRRIPIIG